MTLAHMQKCDDANFCKRNRGKTGTRYSVQPESVTVVDGALSATLLNADSTAKFNLTLLAYDGFVRLLVDEVRQTVDRKEDVEAEIAHLMEALASRA